MVCSRSLTRKKLVHVNTFLDWFRAAQIHQCSIRWSELFIFVLSLHHFAIHVAWERSPGQIRIEEVAYLATRNLAPDEHLAFPYAPQYCAFRGVYIHRILIFLPLLLAYRAMVNGVTTKRSNHKLTRLLSLSASKPKISSQCGPHEIPTIQGSYRENLHSQMSMHPKHDTPKQSTQLLRFPFPAPRNTTSPLPLWFADTFGIRTARSLPQEDDEVSREPFDSDVHANSVAHANRVCPKRPIRTTFRLSLWFAHDSESLPLLIQPPADAAQRENPWTIMPMHIQLPTKTDVWKRETL